MNASQARDLAKKIEELQALMVAYSTDGRSAEQPASYRDLFGDVALELEEGKYANPNPHKTIETFYAFCKLQGMKKYAERRTYVAELYADVLLDLKRIQRNAPAPKNWVKANEALTDNLAPIRMQWLKARNFIFAAAPDFENSIKEAISAVESTLMVLLDQPTGSLGKIIQKAKLDSDIERLISQAYGFASNKDFVRHGGTTPSALTKAEAEFFLDFSAASIVYITSKIRPPATEQ